MPELGRDLGQRFQHKTSSCHGGMRNRQLRRIHNCVSEKKNIDVDRTWPLRLNALAPHLFFYPQQFRHELPGLAPGFKCHNAIEKPCLIAHFHWLGVVERRNRYDPAQALEPANCLTQIAVSISYVLSQREIRADAHSS